MALLARDPLKGSGPIDQILSAACAALAVLTAGMGVQKSDVGLVLALLVLCGSFLGYAVSNQAEGRAWKAWDGVFYAIVSIVAITQARSFNRFLPNEGFDVALMYANGLSWMLILGSIFAWRDGTRLFQTVPAIAIFGLVGAWDTFPAASALFFGFLLCASALLARVKQRRMLARAQEALAGEGSRGWSGLTLLNRLRAGPWRKLAGPSFAVAVAGAIILFSVVGAPLVRTSVKGVSGQVSVVLPNRLSPPSSPQGQQEFRSTQPQLRIGRGPNTFRGTPVLVVALDRPRYLRGGTYLSYSRNGWSQTPTVPIELQQIDPAIVGLRQYDPAAFLDDPAILSYRVSFLAGRHDRLYVPGEPWEQPVGSGDFEIYSDGTFGREQPIQSGETFEVRVLVNGRGEIPSQAGRPPANSREEDSGYRNPGPITERVRQFARQAIAGQTTDLGKAQAIQRAIERQVRYNTRAVATPEGVDPVDHFLFVSREGYCDLFASAMTVMAREAGLPARLVTGFYPTNPTRNPDGTMVLLDSDYHAWSEIFFEGVGWVPFDPTGGAPQVEGGERGSAPGERSPWYETEVFQRAIEGLIVLAVVGVVLFLLLSRSGEDRRTYAPGERDMERAYRRFERALVRCLRDLRSPHVGIAEYVATHRLALGEYGDEAASIAAEFERFLYAPPGEVEVATLAKRVEAIRTRLRSIRRGGR